MLSKIFFILSVFAVAGVWSDCGHSAIPELTFRLNGQNIGFPCASTRNIYTTTGRYIPSNIIGVRSQIYKDSAIVVFPRFRVGVPITLGQISLKKGGCQAFVKPFPCWALQEEGNCQAFQSVADVFIDSQVSEGK